MKGYRSKTLAVWMALLGGAFGLHRFYLHGPRDGIGWLFPFPTLAGLWGIDRIDTLGQDDRLAWVLLPMLGLTVSVAMLTAIIHALTPDERWDLTYNANLPGRSTTWGPVIGAVVGLLVGAGALISTIAFTIQKAFESQL